MSFTEPPATPSTPLSPSSADHTQSVVPQSSSMLATQISRRPWAASTTHVTLAAAPQKPQDALLDRRCKHLMRPLAPLLNIETGKPHPHFPKTLLHYHLLSHAELDELAHFYHQRTPTEHSIEYPMPIIARWHAMPDKNDMDIDRETQDAARGLGANVDEISLGRSKRRRFGRFLGLQGMDSAVPSAEGVMREEMERYVAREMAKRESKAREREMWEAKGF